SDPSDSGSLRTPCPPPAYAAGQQGITPAFGYSAPHPSAEGTLTLLTHALPSAHYEPLRHPTAPGLSLAGVRWSSLTTPRGFPCFVRFPCVHAVATTPAQRLSVLLRSLRSVVSAFPDMAVGSACALSFSRLARRSLALRPAHSRCHRISWLAIRRL